MKRALVAFALVGALIGVGASTVRAGLERPADPAWTHVVRPGDTLWDIAEDAAPGEDTRRTVDLLISTNELRGGRIVPGQKLILYAR